MVTFFLPLLCTILSYSFNVFHLCVHMRIYEDIMVCLMAILVPVRVLVTPPCNCTQKCMIIIIIVHISCACRFATSYTPCPSVELVESVWDFKKWLEPYIPRLEQHSRYLVYRSTMCDTKAQMHYKRFSDMQWEPTDNGMTVLYVRVYLYKVN